MSTLGEGHTQRTRRGRPRPAPATAGLSHPRGTRLHTVQRCVGRGRIAAWSPPNYQLRYGTPKPGTPKPGEPSRWQGSVTARDDKAAGPGGEKAERTVSPNALRNDAPQRVGSDNSSVNTGNRSTNENAFSDGFQKHTVLGKQMLTLLLFWFCEEYFSSRVGCTINIENIKYHAGFWVRRAHARGADTCRSLRRQGRKTERK